VMAKPDPPACIYGPGSWASISVVHQSVSIPYANFFVMFSRHGYKRAIYSKRNILGIILVKNNLFPQIRRAVSSFDCFDVKYTLTILFKNSCVLAVRKRAGLSIAKSSHIVWIATKCLSLCPVHHSRDFQKHLQVE
jgi:hypothetical protein